MTELPVEFKEYTRQLMGDERFERYLHSFEEEAPVSIRLNPQRNLSVVDGESVPWCRDGYYLKSRPNFTMDPLFHAGCYYVQEASSMFLDEILRQLLTSYIVPHTSLPPVANRHCSALPCLRIVCSIATSPFATGLTSSWRMSRNGDIRITSSPTTTPETIVPRSHTSTSSSATYPARAKVCSEKTRLPSVNGVSRT